MSIPLTDPEASYVIGMSFGESQSQFVGALGVGLEQFILLDHAAEGVGSDLAASQQSLFDAQPVEQSRSARRAVDFGKDLLHRLGHVLQGHLAGFALIGAGFVLHDGDAVLLITGIPALNGAAGELAGLSVLVGEAHLADGLDAGLNGLAWGAVDGPQHPHLEIGGGITHRCGSSLSVSFFADTGTWPVRRSRLVRGASGGASPCGVVAAQKARTAREWARQIGREERLTPGRAAGKPLEIDPPDRALGQKPFADARPFATADRFGNWPGLPGSGTSNNARHPTVAAAVSKGDRPTPAPRAGAATPPPI